MSKLDKALFLLRQTEIHTDDSSSLDARIGIIVSILYLVMMLSIHIGRLSMLIWMALYPIITSAWLGMRFSGIFKASLLVLPLVFIIGIFNPIYERTSVFNVFGINISEGWISFFTIMLRGLLAMQCMLILIKSNGFLGLCRGLSKLGVPRFITEQLMFVYRYIIVLLEQALAMKSAREARGYGKRSFPIRIWGVMMGQLFLRTIDRSERISKAMSARGFTGSLPDYNPTSHKIQSRDWLFLIIWLIALPLLRIFDFSRLFF